MSINNGLKAYVRYDKTGRIVPGGPIFSHTKPKNGDWVEVESLDCCTTTTSTSTSTTTSTTTAVPTTRQNWVPFAYTIFKGGPVADRVSWWSGNTVANVTAANSDYIFTAISSSEITGGSAYIQSRTLKENDLATPVTIVPTYTFFDNIGQGTGIIHNLQDAYNYTVKIINNSFLASRNPTIVIKRASLPQVGIPIDGWFIVTVDFDAVGNELIGYNETYNSYNNITLPGVVVLPWAYDQIYYSATYSQNPVYMTLGPDSTTWVNGVTVLPSGFTVEENFPIPGTW